MEAVHEKEKEEGKKKHHRREKERKENTTGKTGEEGDETDNKAHHIEANFPDTKETDASQRVYVRISIYITIHIFLDTSIRFFFFIFSATAGRGGMVQRKEGANEGR